jgi:transposase
MTMTTAALLDRAHDGVVAEDDPAPKPTRRRFTAAYKLEILEEYERTTDAGAKGALLRREGLYSSHIVEWRRAREVGALAGLAPTLRRSKRSAESRQLEQANRKVERLEAQLQKHRQALEIQGKASELLSRLLAESAEETAQQPERPKP